MLADTLNSPLENELDLLVRIRSQSAVVVLQKGQVALPQVHLRRVVPERALKNTLGLTDCLASGRLRVYVLALACSVAALATLKQERYVVSDIRRVDRVLVADVLEQLHVFLVLAGVLADAFHLPRLFDKLGHGRARCLLRQVVLCNTLLHFDFYYYIKTPAAAATAAQMDYHATPICTCTLQN